ncbi:hypothetical protein HN604_00040 [archaeon]|jgi:hypothetical protein|nr:hypothetical protein [archaeon]MBT6182997.1 hypothetical protein [archaeon]MBT6606051.1 hypothetical protein [archaeon]MBT7251694.1 hypothetical protein [archaeon]MBT7660454.1 hypothetical protein [archaeon]
MKLKKVIYFFSGIMVLIIILGVILSSSIEKKINFEKNQGDDPQNSENKEGQEQTNQESESAEEESGTSSSSSGGSGGGSGGSSGQAAPDGCSYQRISYTIGNQNITEECTNYLGEICIEETQKCFVDVQNLDDEITGIFAGNILFIEEGLTPENYFEITPFSENLGPGEVVQLESTTIITEEVLIAGEIACFYETLQIPEKLVC